ncbi:hypothetical protein [Enterobacter sp. JMULE2]|uniref:hypothetical protein n=1 Tax=Enterobacter sp. JMULE2 TaxID=2518340 RepID=UPI0020C849BB|nr:hypothetical protein [Enterobacter sp. JMULE2]
MRRQKGAGAQLQQRLEGVLAASDGPVQAQSELHRLTFAIDRLKSQGWINAVVTDKEWRRESLRDEYAGSGHCWSANQSWCASSRTQAGCWDRSRS